MAKNAVLYDKVQFANVNCNEYQTYKNLSEALVASEQLDLEKLYKSLKDKIKKAKSNYKKYALAYKSSKRKEDGTKLDLQMEAKTIEELTNLASFANNLKQRLENLIDDISKFNKDNVTCSGEWVTKKAEKEREKEEKKKKKKKGQK